MTTRLLRTGCMLECCPCDCGRSPHSTTHHCCGRFRGCRHHYRYRRHWHWYWYCHCCHCCSHCPVSHLTPPFSRSSLRHHIRRTPPHPHHHNHSRRLPFAPRFHPHPRSQAPTTRHWRSSVSAECTETRPRRPLPSRPHPRPWRGLAPPVRPAAAPVAPLRARQARTTTTTTTAVQGLPS